MLPKKTNGMDAAHVMSYISLPQWMYLLLYFTLWSDRFMPAIYNSLNFSCQLATWRIDDAQIDALHPQTLEESWCIEECKMKLTATMRGRWEKLFLELCLCLQEKVYFSNYKFASIST